MARLILGVTGASGIILAHHALRFLVDAGHQVELVASKAALYTASLELEQKGVEGFVEGWDEEKRNKVTIHRSGDLGASIASGSYQVDGMVILPCSMNTLAAIALGLADNLVRRAASVMVKERRPLILSPREMPYHCVHLEHMTKLATMGVVIAPPQPGWYVKPQTLAEAEEWMVVRILDQLPIDPLPCCRWGT